MPAIKKYMELRGCITDWADYTPTLVWTTGTPAAITTIARWCQIGFIVFFTVDISSADSNACTNLTITLPKTPARVVGEIRISSLERYGAAGANYANALGFIDLTASPPKLAFHSFQTATDGQIVEVHANGSYEVSI